MEFLDGLGNEKESNKRWTLFLCSHIGIVVGVAVAAVFLIIVHTGIGVCVEKIGHIIHPLSLRGPCKVNDRPRGRGGEFSLTGDIEVIAEREKEKPTVI